MIKESESKTNLKGLKTNFYNPYNPNSLNYQNFWTFQKDLEKFLLRLEQTPLISNCLKQNAILK